MNQPAHILRTLDSNLAEPARLIIYGRAALALGFPGAGRMFEATMDVDAILPEVEMSVIDSDENFWNAIELTNDQLQASGLYITRLFTDSQVILRPDWLSHIVPVSIDSLIRLSLFRPSTEDLILTKMMRVDPQDRHDIEFLLQSMDIDFAAAAALLASARIPALPEIREAFEQNSEWLLTHISAN